MADKKFCSNCGQEVAGATAKAAANPVVKYCPECGYKLSKEGKCPNKNCANYNEIPSAA